MFSIKVAFTQELEPDLVSKAIMYFLKTNYSHVMILFEDVDGKEKILHSIGQGTCIDEDKKYLESHKIVKMYEVPMKVSREVFAGYARGRVGREYSQSQYVDMILEKLGIKWKPFSNGNSKGVCSEEVTAAAPMSQLELPSDLDLDLIDPKEVDDFLAKQPLAKQVA
jgi:hypothetical protein